MKRPANWLALLLAVPALIVTMLSCSPVPAAKAGSTVPEVVAGYLDEYFAFYPSKATAAGRHDHDSQFEDLSPERLAHWLETQRRVQRQLQAAIAAGVLDDEDALDAELLLRQAEVEEFELSRERRPERDPLFWTEILGNATVFLLVRDDLPVEDRLASAADRALLLPRLAAQARASLSTADLARVSPDLTRIAASQARASATFYRQGFAAAAQGDGVLEARLASAGAVAASALEELAAFLDGLAREASGSPQMGPHRYEQRFARVTGQRQGSAFFEQQAVEALAAKISEAASYGRQVWPEWMPGEDPPVDDKALLAQLFGRVSRDRAQETAEFVADYKTLVVESERFLRERNLITLPDPLTLVTDQSPSFFVGQSVGGVYPAGPFAPEAKTLWFLPTPSGHASPAEKEAFFRDFNHHFNVMITPHEILPGHYLQLKWAARHPRKIRALFPDGIYVEGWGTFCERLLLDQGWGGPLDRLAHLKKQLENIARTIVDIRVHCEGWERDDVLRFVQEEALQDEQFAANMWRRAITSSPQLTSYFLGYREVFGLYEDLREHHGERFELKAFMDRMMALGPVPVRRYREQVFPELARRD